MKRSLPKYWKIYRYVGFEYILSFIVAFFFFFFIFFVNQILVLAQKILLKNVTITDMLTLVVLSIPQFLLYTMPFSSLASASMVIGNLSSQNEILALRSCGIHTKKIFRPIVIISVILSVSTFFIADRMIPYTTEQYRVLYSKLLQNMPTIELDSYSSTQFGNRVISNGLVQDNVINDVLIYDDSNSSERRVVSADSGCISVIDLDNFIYKINLKNPQIMITDKDSIEKYSLASAKDMDLYLKLSSNTYGLTSATPSQMSINQLLEYIKERKVENDSIVSAHKLSISSSAAKLGKMLYDLSEKGASESSIESICNQQNKIREKKAERQFSFYYQYYRSELNKKIALSLACTFLVFIAFPISFFKVKNGRLIGFGLSMFVACAYWFYLYFMHVSAVRNSINPLFYMWAPNATVFVIGIVLLWRLRKN